MKLRNWIVLAVAFFGVSAFMLVTTPVASQPALQAATETITAVGTAPATQVTPTLTAVASASATMPSTLPATTTLTTTAVASASATVPATISATAPATNTVSVTPIPPTVTAATVSTSAPLPAPAQFSYVRAANVSPDAGPLDIYLNGLAAFTNLKFGDSTNFAQVQPGSYTIDLRPAGAAVTTEPMNTLNIVLARGVSADLIALGLTKGTGAEVFQLGVFVTDRSPTKGRTRVEIIHAAPGVGDVDVLQDNKPVLTQIKFGKMGNAPLNLDAGTYHFAVAPTGKLTPVAVDLAGVQLQADTIYTIVVADQQPGTSPPNALTLTSKPQ